MSLNLRKAGLIGITVGYVSINEGFQEMYNNINNREIKIHAHMLFASAYVPVDDVKPHFIVPESLLQHNNRLLGVLGELSH